MSYITYRRWFSLFLGALTGFIFGLFSQGINHLYMPGVPLYQPPFGPVGNLLLSTLAGLLLGTVTGWMESSAISVLLSSLLGALFIAISTLLTGQDPGIPLWHRLTAVAIIFVPTAGLVAPLLIFFRWLVSREESSYRETQSGHPPARLSRYAVPLGLLLLAGGTGWLALYPNLGRAVTPQMHQLIQQGMQSRSSLPAPLQPPEVNRFKEQAQGSYSLQWDKDDHNQFEIPRPASNAAEQSTVIAHFENGYLLVCMFPGKTGTPTCRDF